MLPFRWLRKSEKYDSFQCNNHSQNSYSGHFPQGGTLILMDMSNLEYSSTHTQYMLNFLYMVMKCVFFQKKINSFYQIPGYMIPSKYIHKQLLYLNIFSLR